MNLSGKRMLVVVGARFIGSHIVEELVAEDVAEIRVIDSD